RPLGAAATRRLAHVGWSITNSAASRPATPCIDQAPGLHGIASEAAAQPICRFSERSITLRFRRRRQIEEAPLHVLAASIQVRQADADQPYWTTATGSQLPQQLPRNCEDRPLRLHWAVQRAASRTHAEVGEAKLDGDGAGEQILAA